MIADRERHLRIRLLGCGLARVAVIVLIAVAQPSVAWAKTYTVGAHGAYPSLESALAAAAGDPGAADVRVEVGWYGESDLEAKVGPGRELTVWGGWDWRFSQRIDDPAATVLDGQGKGWILRVVVDHGKLNVEGLTFRGALIGDADTDGAALIVENDGGEAVVERCAFVENRHTLSAYSFAVGAALLLDSDWKQGTYRVRDNVFRDNRIEAVIGFAGASAIYASMHDGAIEVSGNFFERNVAEAYVTHSSAGVIKTDLGSVVFDDNVVVDNATVDSGAAFWWTRPAAISLAVGVGTIDARRNHFLANRNASGDGSQLQILTNASTTVTLSDSLIAASPDAAGLFLAVDGVANVVNCTIADNGVGNVRAQGLWGQGQLSLVNSIVFSSPGSGGFQIKASIPVSQSRNLVGVDPAFVDAAQGDYRLRASSPAIDLGDHSPPGGLGPLDLDRAPRVLGARVDLGAYESF